LAIFQEFNIVLKLAKCKHGLKQLQILGHDLEVGVGVRPSQTSIQALLDMAPPRDVSQLMSLNGLLQWVGGRHVDHLAERMAPLTDLLAGQPRSKKGSRQPIQWSEEADRAFAELKEIVSSERVQLVVPLEDDPGYKVELAVSFDASEIGAGATLWQRAVWSAEKPHEVLRPLDGSWHPLEFYSHKWSASERRRNVTEKECLALVLGTRSWWRYLTGRRFVVFTDHRNLIFMRASSNRKVIRWDSEMSEFNFEVYHVPGDTNVLPDFLSRCGHPTLEELPAGRLGEGTVTAVVTRSQAQVEDISPPVDTSNPLGGPEPDDPLPWIHELSQALGSGMEQPELEVVQRRGFTMVDGLWRDSEGLVYIPEGGRSSALVGAHEMAGHFGVPRVVRLLKEAGVTWPGIVEDVKRHVASCPACQLVKADGRLPDGPQQTPEFRTEGVLALGWELDVAGPINPHSEEGYTHILMCVEVGYRYVELIPIRAPVTAARLMDAFCNRVVFRYGPPVLVKSDGARSRTVPVT
jgi:hypothetical protein